jgi:NAD(P)-dependent dehydrogenase (short-subunit alcohol dehydrogenase family)
VVKRWARSKTRGKVVFLSSILSVVSPPMVGAYSATKPAVQAIAETMEDERPFGIQVQTINPGPYLTGFNETMVEAAYRWLDDAVTFTPRAMVKEVTDASCDGVMSLSVGRIGWFEDERVARFSWFVFIDASLAGTDRLRPEAWTGSRAGSRPSSPGSA